MKSCRAHFCNGMSISFVLPKLQKEQIYLGTIFAGGGWEAEEQSRGNLRYHRYGV